MTKQHRVIAGLAASLFFPGGIAGATVEGRVVDDRNRPIPGATVWLHVRPDGQTRPKPYSAWTPTSPDGTFSFRSVPAGRFVACAQAPNSPFVDGCLWQPPMTITLSASTVRDVGRIQLQPGHSLRVRVDDPKGEFHSAREARNEMGLRPGVWTPTGFFVPLEKKREEPGAVEYGVIVPFDTQVDVTIQSGRFRLGDERGAAVDQAKGFRQKFIAKPGRDVAPLRLQVVGVQEP